MTVEEFQKLIQPLTEALQGRAIDGELQSWLNESYPPDGPAFGEIEKACHAAIEAGWMCNREAGGIAFGRVIKPSPATHGFSVDVVRMEDIKGPHHRHPNGEIDMVMPTAGDAKFDGTPRGWKVYAPDSAHDPTVTDGAALVLYLLPDGAIEFTK